MISCAKMWAPLRPANIMWHAGFGPVAPDLEISVLIHEHLALATSRPKGIVGQKNGMYLQFMVFLVGENDDEATDFGVTPIFRHTYLLGPSTRSALPNYPHTGQLT